MALAVDPAFWGGRRVLVTGHTGFKGTWLALWLHSLGAEVTGFARSAPTKPSLFEFAGLDGLVASVTGDVGDLAGLRATLRRSKAEIVIHLAAQPLIRRAYAEPVETYASNVMGTVHLLEAVRAVPSIRVVVVVTTDKVYENREWVWGYREDDRLGGADPYAASKACAELVCASYRRSFFTGPAAARLATARAGNVIGGGDWAPDRLLPDLIRGAEAGQVVSIRNPAARRPWQHVLNPLSGYLLLARRLWADPGFAGPWNFGPDRRDVRSVATVADRLAELWGEELRWSDDSSDEQKPHEATLLELDSARARTHLGWRPAWDLDAALESIVAFHRSQAGGANVRGLMLEQIRAYGGGG